jgi:hypothetical protein
MAYMKMNTVFDFTPGYSYWVTLFTMPNGNLSIATSRKMTSNNYPSIGRLAYPIGTATINLGACLILFAVPYDGHNPFMYVIIGLLFFSPS